MNKNFDFNEISLDDVTMDDIAAMAESSTDSYQDYEDNVDDDHGFPADDDETGEAVEASEDDATETVSTVTGAVPSTAGVVATVAAGAASGASEGARKVGRPFDTSGKTKLGQARLIYAANPTLAPKELKAIFQTKLGVKPQVAQTYASIVRRK